ncbi:GAF domain-containing sensor histidine kinase [Ramlibacter montanisoli]|uniref:histidine kinase n=1 Tax=Ramlibacter montanisoli TaxID=2732512 RepID=A0A849KAF5_9BURK|nr:ATP-binding protein [Ramlibacter montanisoli]NNU42025.1 GAF domain-containing protein [Ramlibacter montanisoli]
MVDAIPGLVWTAGADGDVDFVNARWREYTGMSAGESSGRGCWKAIHPDDRAAVQQQWASIHASGRAGEMEARLRRSDGAYRWHRFRVAPSMGASGAVDGWCGLNTDIEDRKRAQALLAGENKLLEMVASGCRLPVVLDALCRVFEQVTDECTCSVILVDAGGTHLQQGASPSLDPEFTRSIDGRPVDVENGPCAMAATLNEQVVCADVATETRWSSYGWCRLALSFGVRACWSTPIRSSTGKVVGTFGLHYARPATPTPLHQELIAQFTHLASIAIMRVLEEEALEKVRSEFAHVARVTSLGTLAASIAHEVNQPLCGIISNAGAGLRMLSSVPPRVENAEETVKRILRDANRASDVIARLRALFGGKPSRTDLIDLSESSREVIALSLGELQRHRVILLTDLPSSLPAVRADRVQVQQVILNLLLNALESMRRVDHRPRELLIRTAREEGGRVLLTVKDSGLGLDTELAERVFEPFYTTKQNGMGIGLSVSRTIVESHQGRIWATPGHSGASFSFSLPEAKHQDA